MQNSKTEFIRFVMSLFENNSSDEEKSREYLSSQGLNADAMVSETQKRIKRLQMELNAQKTCFEMDAANDVKEEAEALVNELLSKKDFNLASIVTEEELTFSFRNLRSGDMVLCRHSFPAVSLCVKLLSINKSAHVIGIDTGNFIIKTINDTKKDGVEFTMVNVIAQLKHNLTKIIEKFVTTHLVTEREAMDEPFIFMLDETIKIIESLTKEKDTPEMVIDRVKKIFKETKSEGICLSTIHKSKGLEADRVFILHPELMPSNKAKTKIEIEQENNLIYVAYTRAINTLGFIYDYNAYNSHATLKDSDKIIIGSSSHVGNIGEKKMLTLEIIKIKEVDTKFGKTKIFEMIDKDSNKFSKFGEIDREFLIGNNNKIDVGSKVYFCGQIRAHTEFNGEKITQIGRIS